jgi:hypothetical protein
MTKHSIIPGVLLIISVVLHAQERDRRSLSYFEGGPSAGIHYSSTTTIDLNLYTDFYNPMNNSYSLIATTDLGVELGIRNELPILGFRAGANIAWGLHAENFISFIAGVQPVFYTDLYDHVFFLRPKLGLLFGETIDLSFGYNWNLLNTENGVVPYNEEVIMLTIRPWFNAEARRIHL